MQNQVKQLTMMQDEVKRLSKKIKELKVDEELRLLKEFNNPKKSGAKASGSLLSASTATDAPHPPIVADGKSSWSDASRSSGPGRLAINLVKPEAVDVEII
jgi:hypothetical protein